MNNKLLDYSESVASLTHLKDQNGNHHEDRFNVDALLRHFHIALSSC